LLDVTGLPRRSLRSLLAMTGARFSALVLAVRVSHRSRIPPPHRESIMPSPDQDPDFPHVTWDIRRIGRAWTATEARQRWDLTPEKFEMYQGRLFWDDEQRLLLLGLLLENIGVDRAIRMGDPTVWRAAIDALDG